MRKKLQCPICDSKKLLLLKIVDGIRIFECKKCKLGISEENKKINLYTDKDLYNSTLYEENQRRQIGKFQYIAGLVNKLPINSVLEIGGGYGLFSKVLSKNDKLKIHVIEPNLTSRYTKSIKTIRRQKISFDDFCYKNKQKFDLIIFLDVFEHLEKPKTVLLRAKRLLNKNGFILILLPNYRSLMAKICENWSWWMIEDHKYHFSAQSLTKLLLEQEFYIKKIETFEDYYDFKKNLDGNFLKINNPLLRKTYKMIFLSLFIPLYLLSRTLIWKLKYGGLLLVIAQKKMS